MNDFLPEEGRTAEDPCSTFNKFFTRRVTESARPFVQGTQFPAPCDARYFAYEALNDDVSISVKGACFKSSALVNHPDWNGVFDNGPDLSLVFVPWIIIDFISRFGQGT